MRRLLASLALVMMCLTAVPAPAGAFDPFGQACSGGKTDASAACKADGSNPIAGPDGLLLKVTDIIAYLAGALAIVMILFGAVRFITSGSDVSTGSRTDTDVEDARRSIAGALVGLAIIILARAIITYVIKRL